MAQSLRIYSARLFMTASNLAALLALLLDRETFEEGTPLMEMHMHPIPGHLSIDEVDREINGNDWP